MTNSYYNGTTVNRHTLAQAETLTTAFSSVAAGFELLPDPSLLDENRVTYAVDTGAADAYAIALPQTASAYTEGMMVRVKFTNTNTGASTLNVDSLGARSIKLVNGNDPAAGDLTSGDIYDLVYKGTTFVLLAAPRSYLNNVVTSSASVTITGGAIDGTPIGGTTPAAGAFTTLSASGVATIDLSTISSAGHLAIADGGTGAGTAAQARTNLGLAIGSDVQAYDAGLTSIAGLTTAADRMIYTTAADTYAVATLTSAGRALLDDADASAQRTTLGLGSIATQAASSVAITGGAINGATVGSTTPAAGAFTTLSASGDVTFDTSTLVVDSTNNRVGIGTASPSAALDVNGGIKLTSAAAVANAVTKSVDDGVLYLSGGTDASSTGASIALYGQNQTSFPNLLILEGDEVICRNVGDGEHFRVTSVGLGIGESSPSEALDIVDTGGVAVVLSNSVSDSTTKTGQYCFRHYTAAEEHVIAVRGESKASENRVYIGGGTAAYNAATHIDFRTAANTTTLTGTNRLTIDSSGHLLAGTDNAQTLGGASNRWSVVYAGTGTINTSDARAKTDTADLDAAERAAAVAAKGLLKKFRFKDAKDAKGEAARWHFGIIAQELAAAFEAEGLDPWAYGLLCRDFWVQADVTIPAEYDDVEITPAVYERRESVPERIENRTFATLADVPDGATNVVEHDRMGVRYDELFAFILAAL